MYDLELNRIKEEILKISPKRVLLQLPDGLKPRSKDIVSSIKEYSDCTVIIWSGSCFGACDYPSNLEGIDLMIAFGHSKWN